MINVWLMAVLSALNLSGAISPEVTEAPLSQTLPPSVSLCLQATAPQEEKTADALLAGAEARIDKIRKADMTILVVDRNGRPLPNAQVKIEQIRHDFLF